MHPIDTALDVAALAHLHQVRKGTETPYITHPCGVGILLAQAGCDNEVIAAGLLHDTLEDGNLRASDLAQRFGQRVADIVVGSSEPEHESLSWETRKEHTIATLRSALPEIRLVACADKLHNVRSMITDYASVGEKLWSRFRRGKDKQAWYYHSVTTSLQPRANETQLAGLHKQLAQAIDELFGHQE